MTFPYIPLYFQFSPVLEETPLPLSSDGVSSEVLTPSRDRPPGASPPSARRRTDEHTIDPSSPLPLLGDLSSPLSYPRPQGGLSRAIKEMEISSPLSYFSESMGVTPRGTGLGGTPLRPRGDIQSETRLRTVTIGDTSSQADVRS